MPSPRKLLLFTLVVAALAAGLAADIWMRRGDSPPEIAGFVYPEPRAMSPFKLIAQDGSTFDVERLRGKWSFVYFGYTSCPDVCPTTLAELSGAQRLLDAAHLDGDNQYFFVTVDPKRDTRERVGQYAGSFNKKFVGVTGDASALEKFTQQAGVFYEYPEGTGGDSYTVSHSSVIALFDPNAHLHAIFTPPHTAKAMADGFRKIRERWSESPA